MAFWEILASPKGFILGPPFSPRPIRIYLMAMWEIVQNRDRNPWNSGIDSEKAAESTLKKLDSENTRIDSGKS